MGTLNKTKLTVKRTMGVFAMVVMILTSFAATSYGCWAFLSAEDLVNQAEVIVAGEIVGRTDDVIIQDGDHSYQMLGWEVKADYYLKGGDQADTLKVLTYDQSTSLHYELGKAGDQVLLFLNEQSTGEGELAGYQPLTPQGVIQVTYSNGKPDRESIGTSEELMSHLSLEGNGMDELYEAELRERLIAQSLKVVATQTAPAVAENVNTVFGSKLIPPAILSAFVLVLGALVKFFRLG